MSRDRETRSEHTQPPPQFDWQAELKVCSLQVWRFALPYIISLLQIIEHQGLALWAYLNELFFTKEKNAHNDIVLITGSGGCLGRNLALEFAKRGATLVLWDINEAMNKKTADFVKSQGHTNVKMHTYTIDLSNEQQLRETARKVNDEIGGVSIVIMAACVPFTPKTVLDVTTEDIMKQFMVSYLSQTWLIQEFVKPMVARNYGHFVTISSSSAIVDLPLISAYASSKSAQVKQLETLREELLVDGITGVKTTAVFMNILDSGIATSFADSYIFDKGVAITGVDAAEQIAAGVLKNRTVLFVNGSLRYLICGKYLFTPAILASLVAWKAKVSRKYLNFK